MGVNVFHPSRAGNEIRVYHVKGTVREALCMVCNVSQVQWIMIDLTEPAVDGRCNECCPFSDGK